MTKLAVIFMVCSLAGVSVLAGWCYYRVLRESPDGEAPENEDP